MADELPSAEHDEQPFAVLDVGSNSARMIVFRLRAEEHLQGVGHLRERHPEALAGRRVPLGREQPKNDFVGESSIGPRRAAQDAFLGEADAGGRLDHRRVVGEGLELQAVESAYGEPVAAQHAKNVGAEPSVAERRSQRDPDVRGPVVGVDAP